MDNPAFAVGVLQAVRGLPDYLTRIGDRELPAPPDQLREVEALDVLHHQEQEASLFAGIVSADQVGVRQAADRLDLLLKPGNGSRVANPIRPQ